MSDLKDFFSPKSIAVVGASPKRGKLGNVLVENIKKGGWRGKLYFVNPKYAKKNADYFSSLSEIKKLVDLVLIAIPAPLVNQAIEEGARSKPTIKNFAVISSGFKEIGPEGKKLEEALENIARKHNLNILGPNCLGFANPAEKLNATFTDMKLQKGNVAIVSQSGALAVALLDWAANEKIGFSKIISIGNKTVLNESESVEYLAKDKNTRAIALYLEDIRDGSRFKEILSKTTPQKPVIVLKAGKTAAGQKAVSSHTGSLAQDEEIVEAVFEKMNVIYSQNIEEFQDIIHYVSFNQLPSKNELTVLTNAGGPGVMAADFVGKSKEIKLLSLSDEFKKGIGKYLPASAALHNPIDVIGDAPPERYEKVLENIARKFPENPTLVLLTPQNQTDPEKVAAILAKLKNKIASLSTSFMGGEKTAKAKNILRENKIADFENPERALAVLEKLISYQKNKKRFAKIVQRDIPAHSSAFVQEALAEKRKMLFWGKAEKIFKSHGISLAKSTSFENISELKKTKIPYPCVLKTDDPAIAHRWEKKAVILNIQNARELERAFATVRKSAKSKRFLVQPMADPGLELILGMKRDPVFGPVVLCGMGGTFTEIFKDKTVIIPPATAREVASRLSRLDIFPILKGFRGEKRYNLKEITALILALAEIAAENPQIREIDINPLVLYNDGTRGKILDAKIFLS